MKEKLKLPALKIPLPAISNLKMLNWKWAVAAISLLCLVALVFSFIYGRAPKRFSAKELVKTHTKDQPMVTGTATTLTLIHLCEKLLYKPGGYLSNDIAPPMVFMDDIPNWEFGVLTQIRDMADAMRNDFSRSRSQSIENPELVKAQPLFNYDNDSWVFPSSEAQYEKGLDATRKYLEKLSQQNQQDSQFYARADNLGDWLGHVEKRLGSLSQRLSASVGQIRSNTDLAGDNAARQSTNTNRVLLSKTPWLEIDDVFFEARGYTWALLHLLEAIEMDFESVLEKKNAKALVHQIIRELDGAQRTIYSPMILNGNGFGLFANHSLVMASYISRANAAIINLRSLLTQG